MQHKAEEVDLSDTFIPRWQNEMVELDKYWRIIYSNVIEETRRFNLKSVCRKQFYKASKGKKKK